MAKNLYIYRASYDFPRQGAIRDLTPIPMSEGDRIEVCEIEDIDYQSPQLWLKGFNRMTGETGHVPGNFLQFLEVTELRRHAFTQAYFMKPAMCNLCKDYVWNSHIAGMKCEACSACYHQSCSDIAQNNNNPCLGESSDIITPHMRTAKPVQDWSNTNVIEWMAAVNLCNYVEKFKLKKIDGSVLASLGDEDLRKFGIEDSFHRESLLICIRALCGYDQEEVDVDESEAEECISDKSEHMLSEHTFTSVQRCHKCNKYLYGIIRQGLQCQVCGLCIHRQCVQGKVPACGNDRLPHRRRSSFTSEPLFGIDLAIQCMESKDRSVPDVLLVCTEEIQQRIDDSILEVQWDSFYRTPTTTEAINELKRKFDEVDPYNVSFTNFKSAIIGGVVKKYLRELANPVIPVQYYDKFIEAAKEEDAERRGKCITSLVNELPEHHNSTLKYLMTHFCRIAQSSSIIDSKKKLAQVFCHILLRPDWNQIVRMAHNTEYHLRIFEHLYISTTKDISADPPRPNPNGHKQPPPLPDPADPNMQDSLDHCDWFWGDISKEEVHERLSGTPDGSYLVRRATSFATRGDYTLTLRKGGMNRLIKIYHKQGRYGFSEPFEFSSVQHLVEHFTTHSLAEYNRQLNCTLDHPVVNPTRHDTPPQPESVTFMELEQSHREFTNKTARYDQLLEKQNKTTQDIQMLYQAHDSFKELVKVFEEQLELHRTNSMSIVNHEYSKLQQNNTVLESRLRDITESKNRLEASIKEKASENRQLIAQINTAKPEIKSLSKRCEQLRSVLLNGGHDRKYIDEILESSSRREQEPMPSEYGTMSGPPLPNTVVSLPPRPIPTARTIPHKDENTWYREGIDRPRAQEILHGKPEGTFLIRPKEESYALSIVDEKGNDVHCLILRGPEGYGFAEPYIIHHRLMDLVLHYRETSLAEHNPTLNCKLSYPAYAS